MTDEQYLAKPMQLSSMIDYAEGAVVSKTLMKKKTGTLTIFAFDKGQDLSEHTSPFDATVQILEGQALLTIGDEEVRPQTGDTVIMPANIPHNVIAEEPFKMLLIMIR